jgi:hypothetical protein
LPGRIFKKLLKVFLWVLGILAGLLVLAWLVILIFFPDEKIRNMMVAELEDRLKVEVQAGDLDLEIFSGLSLKDVVIGAPPGFDRPPLRVERLVVDYSLGQILQKQLTVSQVLVDRPEIHFQVHQGRSNVAALLSQRRAREQPEPEQAETGEDEGGFTLALNRVEVRDARIQVRVPGFSADLSGLNITAAGKLGSPGETLVRARSHLPVPAEPNISVDLDAGPDGPARVRAALGFDVETSLLGQERVESSGGFELRFAGMDEPEFMHRLTVEYQAFLDTDASEAVLNRLEVKLDEKPVLSASGGLTGLDQRIRVRLRVPQLIPPPELVAELLARFLPGLEVAGAFRLEDLSVEGPLEGALPQASAAAVVDELSLAGPGVKLDGLAGKVQVEFQPKGDGGDYTFQSAFTAREGRLAGLRTRGARVTLYAAGSVRMQNGLPELLSPEIGATVNLAGLRGAGIECGRLGFQGRITAGEQPVPIGSPEPLVPAVTVSLAVDSGAARAGPVKARPGKAKLWLSVEQLQLSGGKWQTGKLAGKLDLDSGKLAVGAAGVDRPRVVVDINGEGLAFGRRFPRPLRLSARVRSGSLQTGFASLQAMDVRVGTRLRSLAPASLPLTLKAEADGVILSGEKLAIPEQVKLAVTSALDLRGRTVAVERLKAVLGDLIALQASGRFAFREGKGRVAFGTKPFSIERVVAALPADAGKRLPRLKGELEIKGETEVTLPEGRFDLEKLEHATEVALFVRGVRGVLAGTGLGWREVSGRLKLSAPGPGLSKTTTAVNLTVGKIWWKSSADLSGVSLVLTARRDREDFSLDGRLAAAKMEAAGVLARPLLNSQVQFYGKLAGTKELRLEYVKVALPSLGADLGLSGRFVRIPGAEGFEALRMSAKLEAGLHSPTPVHLPGGLVASGEGSLSLALESDPGGVLSTRGKISFAGLNLKGAGFELESVRGAIPVSQLIATQPTLGLLAGKPGGEEDEKATVSDRSRAYEEALLPMKGRQRSFSIDRVEYQDLRLANLTGNLELAKGSLNLGSLRLRFLEGDVLAEAKVVFAPPGTRKLSLDAQVSGVDLSGLGALQMAGSSDISGNLRLKLDLGEKVFGAAANLTQIGRSTLQALLVAMDPQESNPGVQNLRRFLNRFKVSPKRVSMDIRHGLLSMEVVMNLGFTARAAARLIQGFQGDTFRLKHLPIGGLLNKYLGF